MELHSVALRDTLIHTLRELNDHTESVYLSLARQYPALIKEMERSLDNSASHIGKLTADSTQSSSTGTFGTALESTRNAIRESTRQFQHMLSENNSLFAAMEHGIDHLAVLAELISQIKADSEQMELISLNALTVALKAGGSGRAFSFITEELQRIASNTIQLTEDTIRKGHVLTSLFQRFRSEVARTRTTEQELFTSVQPKLETQLESFSDRIASVHRMLDEIRRNSTAIEKPIFQIMQEIQQQDIIKQSIECIITTLSEMNTDHAGEHRESTLDELSFLIALPDLAKTVLQKVKSRISHSLTVFDREAEKARTIMQAVETSRRTQLATVGKNDSATENTLQSLFGKMRTTMQQKEGLSHNSRNLVQSVFQIEHNFNSFQTLISRFHSINMSSRIEVAKTAVLQDMSGTIEEMNALTSRITEHVQQALDSLQEFIAGTNNSITMYRRMIDNQKSRVESWFAYIRTHFSLLHRTQEELSLQAADFSLFTNSFHHLFDTTQQDLNSLRGLLDDIDIMFITLDRVKQEAFDHRKTILTRLGLDGWDIANKQLIELIDRFSICSQKMETSTHEGLEKDETVADSGEVTLF